MNFQKQTSFRGPFSFAASKSFISSATDARRSPGGPPVRPGDAEDCRGTRCHRACQDIKWIETQQIRERLGSIRSAYRPGPRVHQTDDSAISGSLSSDSGCGTRNSSLHFGHFPLVPAFSSLIFNTDSQPLHVYRMVILRA